MVFFKLFYLLTPGKLTVLINIFKINLDATQARTTQKVLKFKTDFLEKRLYVCVLKFQNNNGNVTI